MNNDSLSFKHEKLKIVFFENFFDSGTFPQFPVRSNFKGKTYFLGAGTPDPLYTER